MLSLFRKSALFEALKAVFVDPNLENDAPELNGRVEELVARYAIPQLAVSSPATRLTRFANCHLATTDPVSVEAEMTFEEPSLLVAAVVSICPSALGGFRPDANDLLIRMNRDREFTPTQSAVGTQLGNGTAIDDFCDLNAFALNLGAARFFMYPLVNPQPRLRFQIKGKFATTNTSGFASNVDVGVNILYIPLSLESF